MTISTDLYATLKSLADDLATARMAPKGLERFVKIVVQDEGKDRIVQKFSAEGTRAAILVMMVENVLTGLSPLAGFAVGADPKKQPPAVEDQSQEAIDEFTAAALAQIAPGKPDSSKLNPPHATIKAGDTYIRHGKGYIQRTEGEEWTDEKGRRWKLIDGKMRQQKKPKVKP